MEFPDAERVIYTRNPLSEVVCQIRFPRILALDERIPAEFQTILGADYPYVETREVAELTIQRGADATASKRIFYDFSTLDRRYTITLSSEFVGVRTVSYDRWDTFLPHIQGALAALEKSYSIPFFTRIGLRYVDVISRRTLGLEGSNWSDLIRNSALGLLPEKAVPVASVLELSTAIALSLDSGGKVAIRTGFGKSEATADEVVFIVDSDFFEEESVKGSADAVALCSRFNRSAGKAFRWIISDTLHEALGPQPVG